MELESLLIHAGVDRDPYTGASSMPIYLASTFDLRDVKSETLHDYSRSGNPTRAALEETIAVLEGGMRGFAFASGMAATSSVLMLFEPGDHLIVSEDVYGGTFRVLSTLFKRWGLTASFVDTTNEEAVTQALTPQTKGVFVESPSNPLLKITDLRFIADFAQKHGLISIVDNTFSTPYLQRPLTLGFDIVVHSATKFLNGHSDILAGLAVTANKDLSERLYFIQNAFGAVLGVQDSWLLLRGIKTLAVRMQTAQKGAQWLAEKLAGNTSISKVYYPGLASHPGYEVHSKQTSGSGSVISFELNDKEITQKFLSCVKMPLVSVSLGGVESILSHPATMSHASMPAEERYARGIKDSLVRLSVGLESPTDLLKDFEQALL